MRQNRMAVNGCRNLNKRDYVTFHIIWRHFSTLCRGGVCQAVPITKLSRAASTTSLVIGKRIDLHKAGDLGQEPVEQPEVAPRNADNRRKGFFIRHAFLW